MLEQKMGFEATSNLGFVGAVRASKLRFLAAFVTLMMRKTALGFVLTATLSANKLAFVNCNN